MRKSNDSHSPKGSRRTPVEEQLQKSRVEGNTQWTPFLLVRYPNILALNLLLLERQTSIEAENPVDTVESGKKNIPLKGRVKAYFWINYCVAFLGFGISILAGLELSARPTDSEGTWTYAAVITLSLIGCIIFVTRAVWIKLFNNRGFRVSNSPDDYALERTTFFAWLLLLIVAPAAQKIDGGQGINQGINIDGGQGIDTVLGWIVALAFWTPIVSIIGSSWGKLKATHPNGDRAVWPLSWGRLRGEVVADIIHEA